MASVIKPKRAAAYGGKPIRLSMVRKLARTSGSGTGPILRFLTILWAQNSGVPFNTSGGFIAVLSRGRQVVATARFDNFGVARFNNITTPTNVRYTLRIFNLQGVLFRRRFIPAGIEAFAVIG
jgi:hypothetical protein